jgi:signal transduction histidine kinase
MSEEVFVQESVGLDAIKELVARQKILPRSQKEYVRVFFLVEEYIVNNTNVSRDAVRRDVRSKFNTAWLSPPLRALFSFKGADGVVFAEIILVALLEVLRPVLGVSALQKLVNTAGIVVSKEGVDVGEFERVVFHDEASLRKARGDISALLLSLFEFSKSSLGASAAERVFGEVFEGLKGKFVRFPVFVEFVKFLPEGVFERERLDLLSKEELEEVSRRLQQVDVMKSEFTSIAAHELKTPLVPMKGFAELMLKHPEKYGLNAEGKRIADTFLRNVVRLERLTDDILDVAKLEAGEMKFVMEEFSLRDLLRNVVADFSVVVKKKGVVLKVDVPEVLPSMVGDRLRLRQVLDNVVRNALKFTVKGSIRVSVRVEKGEVHILVRDSGVGIAKADLENVFGKFFQTEDVMTRKKGGTGLGLAIARMIVEGHHGRVWMESAGVGKGSTVHIVLPLGNK